MSMRHARLETSDRLQRTLAALQAAEELSTLELSQQARIIAVSAAVSELRANGIEVLSRVENKIWYYRLGRPS